MSMKNRNEVTPRKAAQIINDEKDFEQITLEIRENSRKCEPEAKTSIEDDKIYIKRKYGLLIEVRKCVDMPTGNGDILVKIESSKDFNHIICEPSKIHNIFNKLENIGCLIEAELDRECIKKLIWEIIGDKEYSYTHQQIGWGHHLGEKVIKLFNIEAKQETIESEYLGRVKLCKKGTLDEFTQGVKELIVGNSRLELALIASVCGLINQELDESDTNIVINFQGEPSTGKTQTTKLTLILFGDPNKLFRTFHLTENKAEKEIADYRILPVVMDDKLVGIAGKNQEEQCNVLVNNIFRYATGHVKGRMNDKDSLAECYSPIILSTENSIIDLMKSSSSKGQFYRIFEISCRRGELTSSIGHSRKIEKFMRSSYGVAGERFVQYLIRNNMYGNKLKDKFYKWHDEIIRDFEEAGYADRDRMANRMAVIILAGELLNSCFTFGIDLKKVQELLMGAVKAAFDKANEEYDCIKGIQEYINKYKEYFADSRKNCDKYRHLGQYRKNQYGYYELAVCKEALCYILSGKEPKDYLDYLMAKDKGEKFEVSKKAKPMKPTGLLEMLRSWRDKGILTSTRVSAGTKTLTIQETLFNNDRQHNVHIIQFK